MKKYNIGLDIGTTSVGWAVVETDTQKIIKKGSNNLALWGVRLFNEARTAEERRKFRSSRRRYQRRRKRIYFLQQEFIDEINKVDKNFFQKLRESKYQEDDNFNKTLKLSKEEKQQIKEYNQKYKTIYHLRKRLIEDNTKEDIRLVYLAIHHIIKYRGNFNYKGSNFNVDNIDIKSKLKDTVNYIKQFIDPEIEEYSINFDELESVILKKSKTDIKTNIEKNISSNKFFSKEFGKAILGDKFSIKKLLLLDDLEKDISLGFSDSNYDEAVDGIINSLQDKVELLESIKQLYSAIYLKKIFRSSNCNNLSSLMVEKYNNYEKDLKYLKDLIKEDKKAYDCIFKGEECPYYLYSKRISGTDNKGIYSLNDFIKKVKEIFPKFDDMISIEIKEKIENDLFLPRITTASNGEYPYQLNKDELIKIIENQGKYYPFLKEKVEDGTYKIVKILEFKIPYYVGPLVSNEKSQFAWMERKTNDVITPYNFNSIVDKEKTAELFIKRMIRKCTYLLNEPVLPNNSILYCKYKVLNELKQIKVNGFKLEINTQHKIYEELFKKEKNITDKIFKTYLKSTGEFSMYDRLNITGYSSDNKFANNMASYIDFFGTNGIFEDTNYTMDDAEKIIEWITIFEDKDILEQKIRNTFSKLSDLKVRQILSKKYKGWGNLSKKLLIGLITIDKKSNLNKSIMDLIYETDENFMQIINNDNYDFQKQINLNNIINESEILDYSILDNIVASPSIKKGIYQSLKVVDEIVKDRGYDPENIIIEMAREKQPSKRIDDRKKQLLEIYNKNKNEIENYNKLIKELNGYEKIDSQKLFLYFIQEGKCLYTGEPLEIEKFNEYEIDHIIPRTLIKDDSIDNKALVHRVCNQKKAANFVLPVEYRTNRNKEWWAHLRKLNLMSGKKFYNLCRDKYDDEDIKGFINRQLVETRQITKHVGNILNSFYKKTNIIYLKAQISHNYREKFELFKFRDLNNYHHAHDAYLAAVLGEYKEKYMKKDINFEMIKELNKKIGESAKYGYVINCLDDSFIVIKKQNNEILLISTDSLKKNKDYEIIFDTKRFNNIVKNTLYRNDIIISKKTEFKTGEFYKQNIYKKGIGRIPVKNNMDINKYGGYSNVTPSYMTLIKYNNKQKMIGIPTQIVQLPDEKYRIDFMKEQLGVDNFEIVRDKIPFETLINYEGQKVYIKGYSVANKNGELANAVELKIPKEKMIKWKYAFNKILNNADNENYSIDLMTNNAKEIIKYLFDIKNNYPLFADSITKIENRFEVDKMKFEDLSKVIVEVLKIYNGTNGNLKEYGLGDRIGRLSGRTIKSGTFIFKSITGIKEYRSEF